MEKRSGSGRVRKQDDLEKQAQDDIDNGRVVRFADIDKAIEFLDAGESPPKTVRLVCILGTGRYIIDGPISGKRYEFINNNALEIDNEDVNILLSKMRGGCCGNPNPTPIFVKV